MPSSFGQYKGGIQPIQGITEAGSNIAKYTFEGISNFSNALAEGIKGYNENIQKREVVDQQSKALGAQLQRYADIMKTNPDYAGMAEGLQTHIESLSKVPTMSLGSALGAVNGAQAVFQGLDKEIALNDVVRKANIESGIGKAESELPNKEKYDVPALMESGRWGFDSKQSYAQNELAIRTAIRKAKETDPSIKGDEKEAIAKWRSGIQGLATTIQDEKLRATIFDQLEASRRNEQKTEELQTEFEKNGILSGLTKFGEMATNEEVGKDYTLTTETTRSLLDAGKEPLQKAVLTEEEKRKDLQLKEALTEKFTPIKTDVDVVRQTGIDLRIAYLNYLKDKAIAVDDANAGSLSMNAGKPENIRKAYTHLIPDNPVSKMGIYKDVNGNYYKGISNPSIGKLTDKEQISEEHGVALSRALDENEALVKEDVDKLLDEMKVGGRFVELAKQGFGLAPPNKLTSEQRIAGLNFIDKKIEELKAEKQKPVVTPAERKSEIRASMEAKPSAEQEKSMPVLVGKEPLQFGIQERVRDISVQQKRAQVADYFRDKLFGYVPSGFNEIYSKMHPESLLQTTQVNGQTLLWDGQKWTQMTGDKQLTVEEQLKLRSRQFGAIDKNGKPIKTEVIPNSGIYAYGSFNSASTKKVDDFRSLVSTTAQVEEALDNLERLNKKFGSSLDLSDRGEAAQWKAKIRSLLKQEVANTGSVSDFEQRMITDVTPAVTDLLSLTGVNQRNIDTLRLKMRNGLQREGSAFGVDIEIRSGASSNEARLREAKLNQYRAK